MTETPTCTRTALLAEWAGFIRLQIEAIPLDRTVTSGIYAPGPPRDTSKEFGRLCEIRKRERELLPAIRARLMPACPPKPHGCGGEAWGYGPEFDENLRCPLCSGSGVCPGMLDRGLPRCEVPLAAIGREEYSRCDRCRGTGTIVCFRGLGATKPYHKDCPDCDKLGGWGRVFVPSAWARKANWERGCWMVPSDANPVVTTSANGPGDSFDWEDGSQLFGDEPQRLPHSLFVEVCKLAGTTAKYCYAEFPTEPAAMSALATAVNGLIDRPRDEVTER